MKAIRTRSIPATDFNQTKIRASDSDNNASVMSWSYEFDTYDEHHNAATQFVKAQEWDKTNKYRLVGGEFKKDYYWIMVLNNEE